MRTFSKSAGLAGLRIGYALAPAEIVAAFDRVRQPFNTSILAQVAGLAALEDEEFLERTRRLVAEGLDTFYACFDRLGLFHPKSQANFVLVRVGPRAGQICDALLRRGVIVRHMGSYGLPDFLRVSVGLAGENARFVEEFTRLVEEAA
jgi:histidinol-phosphate aminotransferase